MRHHNFAASRYDSAGVKFQADTILFYGGVLLSRLLLPSDAQEFVISRLTEDYTEDVLRFGIQTVDYFAS